MVKIFSFWTLRFDYNICTFLFRRIVTRQEESMQVLGCRFLRCLFMLLLRCVRAGMLKDFIRRLVQERSKVCVPVPVLRSLTLLFFSACCHSVIIVLFMSLPLLRFTFVARFHWDWLWLWATWGTRSCTKNWRAHSEWVPQPSAGAAQGSGGWKRPVMCFLCHIIEQTIKNMSRFEWRCCAVCTVYRTGYHMSWVINPKTN